MDNIQAPLHSSSHFAIFLFNSCLWSHSYRNLNTNSNWFSWVSHTSVEVDSYILSPNEIEVWLIYYEIQHCLPLVMGYGWPVMVEGGFSFDKLIIFFAFPCGGHFSFLPFFWQTRLISYLICLSFGLWRVQKEDLDISLYLTEATALRHSKEWTYLTPSWCIFDPISLSTSWTLTPISFHFISNLNIQT